MTGISMHQSDLRVVSDWLLFSPHGNLLHSKNVTFTAKPNSKVMEMRR